MVGAHRAADCAVLSRGCIVTSTVMKENKQVSLMNQETIGIIYD